jgi:hypothetical protein
LNEKDQFGFSLFGQPAITRRPFSFCEGGLVRNEPLNKALGGSWRRGSLYTKGGDMLIHKTEYGLVFEKTVSIGWFLM